MQVSNVSFGKLIAVSGKASRIKNIDKRYAGKADVIMIKDVTSIYEHAFPSGMLAQAAQRGDRVKLYITGEERENIKNGVSGWDSTDAILEHIQDYYDANKMSMSQVLGVISKHD